MNELKYHNVDYSIAQFIEEFTADLPVVILITTGSGGCGNEIHCISADEIYWISGFQRQKRVVVKEVTVDKKVTPKYLSIPVDYPARFHRAEDRKSKKYGPAKPMSDVVEDMKVNPAPHLIAFENNANVSFSVSGTKSRSATLGLMEIIDTYYQKYLVGHPISDNTMYSVNLAIPVYMDITMDVAAGFKGRSRQTFQEWMKAVNNLGCSYQAPEAKMNPDIVEFGEIPDGGHYEYMQPGKHLTRNTTNNQKNSYTSLVLPTDSNPELPPRSKSTSCTETPPGGAPLLPPARHGSNAHRDSRSLSRKPEKTRLPPVRPVSPTLVSVRDIKKVSEIPENLDFKGLSAEDVAHCLCLLGMWRHAVDLRERMVDGAMLMRLDTNILVSEFKFAEFDAVQLVKFIGGWRPKQI